MRKRPAPVNVTHQQASGIGVQRHAHVDDIAVLQINFGGRACALYHHHIVLSHQFIKCLRDHGPDRRTAFMPGHF